MGRRFAESLVFGQGAIEFLEVLPRLCRVPARLRRASCCRLRRYTPRNPGMPLPPRALADAGRRSLRSLQDNPWCCFGGCGAAAAGSRRPASSASPRRNWLRAPALPRSALPFIMLLACSSSASLVQASFSSMAWLAFCSSPECWMATAASAPNKNPPTCAQCATPPAVPESDP